MYSELLEYDVHSDIVLLGIKLIYETTKRMKKATKSSDLNVIYVHLNTEYLSGTMQFQYEHDGSYRTVTMDIEGSHMPAVYYHIEYYYCNGMDIGEFTHKIHTEQYSQITCKFEQMISFLDQRHMQVQLLMKMMGTKGKRHSLSVPFILLRHFLTIAEL